PPPCELVAAPRQLLLRREQLEPGLKPFSTCTCLVFRHLSSLLPSLHERPHARCAGLSCTKAANWRSSALATPLRQPSARGWDARWGKISPPPFSNPSRMPTAADSGEAFGISKPRFMSVSMGPRKTAWTVTPSPARSALNDCVMLNAAAFEMEYAGMTGKGAS